MAKHKRRQTLSPEEREQRELLNYLRDELNDLHEISLITLSDEGILPPMYAGEYLGEDREVIPLWGIGDESPELGAMLLRVVKGVEPNSDLDQMRDELGLSNDWPVSELLDMLVTDDGKSMVDGGEKLRDLNMLFMLDSSQIDPAPGLDRETMLQFIGEMQPYAVFVKIPTTGEDEAVEYLWDDLDKYSAEVVYADTPQLLEAAVWEYRLNHALQTEIEEIEEQNLVPADELLGQDAAELGAIFDTVVMHGFRLYGTTSAVRARQQELDVLREENGDLLVKAPLRREVEPVGLMSDFRHELPGDDQGLIMHLKADSEVLQHVWPTIRAHNFFLIKVRHGLYAEDGQGRLQVKGFRDTALMEWNVAETLPQLQRIARLSSIYELLAACELVEGKVRSAE